jgi:hypothetical protein
VLLTVTPFRLRQEAVLTGALLHEAGHARHSLWIPEDGNLLHSNGKPPTAQTVALARTLEEGRIEGIMAHDADHIGASGLGWTMRASAAHLVPMTRLHMTDPEQRIMDLITSWALRAGRQMALVHHMPGHRVPSWVHDFTSLVQQAVLEHLTGLGNEDPSGDARFVMLRLVGMVQCDDDRGPTMIDTARDVLDILFPETDGDSEDAAMPGAGCQAMPEPDEDEGEETEAEPEKGEAASEDEAPEGDEEATSGDESDEEDSDGGESPGEGDDPAEGDEDSESEGSGEGQDGEDGEAEGDDGATDSTDPLAEALAAIEADSKDNTEDEADEEMDKDPGSAGGSGSGIDNGAGWRTPTAAERDTQKGASQFLRDLISPTEASKVTISETPGSMVDGAAHAAWKAGGSVKDPRFFIRTRREVEPSPPVKVAILVDVSSSMSELQHPSALLSWALASAALDLRNFAGRGTQVESTLIHWGNEARVIGRNGVVLPGIREVGCNEGTHAMPEALRLVEEELPGFFDITEKPVHRLLVQFTDWELFGPYKVEKQIARALEAGVNMLTIAPSGYNDRARYSYSDLPKILAGCKVQRGRSSVLNYDSMRPGEVWEEAAKHML